MDNKKSQKNSQEFSCETCTYKTQRHCDYKKHLLSAKHLNLIDDNKIVVHNLSCIQCAYTTQRKCDYDKHILTAKHLRITKSRKSRESREEFSNDCFSCNCGKEYINRHNLSRHKKVCKFEKEPVPNLSNGSKHEPSDNVISANIIIEIIKENQEFKNMLIEQNKQVMELHKENSLLMNKLVEKDSSITTINNNNNNNNNTTNNNNNNQQFNLNFFLNETCKDAMNIQEFIESIKITFEELLTIGNDGFVNGLSDIFVKRLKDLEVNKRPIHCTDSKRETFYLKEIDKWNKDDKDNSKLKNAIEKIEYKNVAALQQWCNENPDSKINNSDNNLLRDKIYLQTLQGDGRTREKIVKNISKEVIIDK